ncbi:hypothetical protein [Ktedonospora formicarum]|uniref:Uncharacterized protein n=1 Tax=Ktedonospora formicarum TaxID=2778364 RepID=A0A8J3I176_9CHLR|nr:hypothetical protein [Ktedonospora formicarum]GHO44798.1 hypothetical protein KSX_29610 [Ktedonospora formicarum]
MSNLHDPSMGGSFFEQPHDGLKQSPSMDPEVSAKEIAREQVLLHALLEQGFLWDEAIKLIRMREHLYENTEMRQRMAEDCHIQFARWLYEQGELNEE